MPAVRGALLSISVAFCALLAMLAVAMPPAAFARTVGETHLSTPLESAGLRDEQGSTSVHVTVWYPAMAGAKETKRLIGPPGQPLFESGEAADEAEPAGGQWPVVLLSHGFGGSARMMGWLGTGLARANMLVIAVDHPGNTAARGALTPAGAGLWWERAEDLRAAWDAVRADPRFARRLDASRVAVVGYSLGGYTALLALGMRADPAALDRFCAQNPDDATCRAPPEAPDMSLARRAELFATPPLDAEAGKAGLDHAIEGLRGGFLIAPALIPALALDGPRPQMPVSVVVGGADTIVPPASNAERLVATLPSASLLALQGVGHYDFLGICTEAGRRQVPFCATEMPQAQTHAATLDIATRFLTELFDKPE